MTSESKLAIERGPCEGHYFTEWRIKELTSLAEEIAEAVPDISNWKVWYDSYHDYHRLEFDLDGHHYTVQLYKIFTLTRDNNDSYDGPFAKKNFYIRTWDIVKLFQSGRYKTWDITEA